MANFGRFYLDKEKDMIVELSMEEGELHYELRTPNHGTGNLITNLAACCDLPLSFDDAGLKVIRGTVPCYINANNEEVYIFRLKGTKVANIYPDGAVEMKASIPAISKTLMSQTKDYHIDFQKTVVKTYIFKECKFRTDLHTHMNGNLPADVLIALGIHHQIFYPLYYIKKLGLRLSEAQRAELGAARKEAEERLLSEGALEGLVGKYYDRKIDDETGINFARLILENLPDAAYNIPRIRNSLAVMKDGQAVFTNLEKIYLYRYVFTKGHAAADAEWPTGDGPGAGVPARMFPLINQLPDPEIADALLQMEADRQNPAYAHFTLFQNKLLWIARHYQQTGVVYAEISDTSLVKKAQAPYVLRQIHECMPAITRETGVLLRFLAALRRIPLVFGPDARDSLYSLRENLQVLKQVAMDPYVAGSDIVGEEISDVLDLKPLIREIVAIAANDPTYVVRIHAGENDSLRDNVYNSIRCVKEALAPGQAMPHIRIGHGLYTANLSSAKGRQMIADLKESGTVLEFQITSNVRLNNLSSMSKHPLKAYLKEGILCVQGTDGGALYGTDSIDEELSLEKMLDLSKDDLLAMRAAEDRVLKASYAAFDMKSTALKAALNGAEIEAFYTARMEAIEPPAQSPAGRRGKLFAQEALASQIAPLMQGRMPVVVMGGSFNNDKHVTRMLPEGQQLIDYLLEHGDPDKMFFVVGHELKAYEKYLVQHNQGRFAIYMVVPKTLTEKEKERAEASGLKVRVSIETSKMGLYKTYAYEIFRRRPSVVIAMDGNSAASNVIQEAKNGKQAVIYINPHSRVLTAKARTLGGYTRMLDDPEVSGAEILKEVEG